MAAKVTKNSTDISLFFAINGGTEEKILLTIKAYIRQVFIRLKVYLNKKKTAVRKEAMTNIKMLERQHKVHYIYKRAVGSGIE